MLGNPGSGDGSVARLCSAAKARPSPVLPKELPLWRMKPNRNSFTSDGVKMWMSESTACSAVVDRVRTAADEARETAHPGRGIAEMENRPNRLFLAEMVWSTRISPWSVFEDRGGP